MSTTLPSTQDVTSSAEETPRATTPSASEKPSSGWMSSFQSLVITIAIAVFVITFIVQAFQIPSGSMENTLLVGDYVLVDKMHFGDPGLLPRVLPYDTIHRRDIVVFRYPVDPKQHFVKRVIGVPGDRISLQHGMVYVNGVAQSEPYVIHSLHNRDTYRDDFPNGRFTNPNVEARWWMQMHKLTDDRGELIVPEGEYFVLGDNRDDSLDSRYWGFVPRGNILGRPLLIYFSIRDNSGLETGVPQDDKLLRFGYLLHHLGDFVRWDRCLRLVR